VDQVLSTLRAAVLAAQRSELTPSWRRAGGSDPYGRLYYVESGAGFVEHHRRRYDMRRGGLYLIPSGTDLALGCPRRVVIRWCHFTATVLGGIDLFAYLPCDHECVPDPSLRVPELFERMVEAHASEDPGKQVLSGGILLELLAPLVATARPDQALRTRLHVGAFRQVLEHIERHLDGRLRVPELAAVAGYEKVYFARVFRRAMGIGPAAYILKRKIESAQRLLLETDSTLDEIAARLAFTDAFHLSKTFRRLTGTPPSAFREARRAVRP
jgi:AraC family transcriptional regulator, arabinose operon regulatory protein